MAFFHFSVGLDLRNLQSELTSLDLGAPEPVGIKSPVSIIGGPGSHFNGHVEENLLGAVNFLLPVS